MTKQSFLWAVAFIATLAFSCKGPIEEVETHEVLPAPTGITIPDDGIGSFSMTIRWDAVDSEDIASYTVAYCESGTTEWKEKTCYALKAEISDLEMKQTYSVKVKANSEAGEEYNSQWSETVSATTIQLIDVSVPTGLKLDWVTSSSIAIEWDAMENAKGYIVSYVSEGADVLYLETTENKCVIKGLQSGTSYAVSVKTCSLSGSDFDSDYCGSINIETFTKAYGIMSSDEFKEFMEILKTDSTGGIYKNDDGVVNLRSDLDLSDYTTFDPEIKFSGVFDGNGFKISNLKLKGTDNVGLFPQVIAATIKNITVDESCSFVVDNGDAVSNAGGIAGIATGGSSFISCINKANVKGASYMGGILGSYLSKDGLISFESCENHGTIALTSSDAVTKNVYMGGICGYSETSAEYKNCKNTGVVSDCNGIDANTYQAVGGMVGLGSDCIYENCSNSGKLVMAPMSGSFTFVGGICARSYRSSFINCSNTVSFEYTAPSARAREANIGGIVGYLGGTPSGTPHKISGCSNTASLRAVADLAMTTKPFIVAGIAANCVMVGAQIMNNTNSGNIESTVYSGNSAVAGIVGWINCASAAKNLGSECGTIKENINTGNVSIDVTGGIWTGVAGVVGTIKTAYTPVENCRNEGNVTIKANSRSNAGGIVCECNASITGCSNSGTITAGDAHNDYYSNIGGIAARFVNKTAQTISSCVNTGNVIYIGEGLKATNNNAGIIGQGGIIGMLQYGNVIDCENTGTILGVTHDTFVRATGLVAGWASVSAVSKIENCRVGGAIGDSDITASDKGVSKATKVTAENFESYIIGKQSKETEISQCTYKDK